MTPSGSFAGSMNSIPMVSSQQAYPGYAGMQSRGSQPTDSRSPYNVEPEFPTTPTRGNEDNFPAQWDD